MPDMVSPCDFIQALVDEQPNYDKYVVEDLRPTDGEIGHIRTGQFPAFAGTALFQDRFNHVSPNTARPWNRVSYESCVGRPCCKTENEIGVGSSRLLYFLEQISYSTPHLCFDQQMHVTHAVEQWNYIISEILKPAVSEIQSMWIRKRILQWAKHRFVARADFGQPSSEFNFSWRLDASGNEVFLLTDQMPTSIMTPQMLQRRVGPLRRIGYYGKNPFQDKTTPPLIQLVAGDHTKWDLEHLVGQSGSGGSPTVASNWRFTEWGAADAFWAYGFVGQIGDYALRVDPYEMRFNFLGASGEAAFPFKFQLVLPYVNIVSSGAGGAMGLKSEDNLNYETARYRFTRVHHKDAVQALVQDVQQINSMMPYASRDFGGKWQVVLPHVRVDENGVVTPIDNRRSNICQFLLDLEMALRPDHTEWMEVYFHMGAPACVTEFKPCGSDPCYPAVCPQDYNAKNEPCPAPDTSITDTPTLDDGITPAAYHLAANTVECNGTAIVHEAVSATTLVELVALLNSKLGMLGIWSTGSPTTIVLSGSDCGTVALPWISTEH